MPVVIFGDTIKKWQFGYAQEYGNTYKNCMPFCHQSPFTRTDYMKEFEFNTKYSIVADYDFFYKLWMKSVRFQYIHRNITVFDCTDSLSTNNQLDCICERAEITNNKKTFLFYLFYFKSFIFHTIRKILPPICTQYIRKWKYKTKKYISEL